MSLAIAVCTTFPNNSFDVYSRKMLQSFAQYWPSEIPLLIAVDDDLLFPDIQKIVRPQDAIAIGWTPEHAAFVERNKSKDKADNYRFQVTRFCHKIFALERALDAAIAQKKSGAQAPRYLIWMDADVITEKQVEFSDIQKCLPKPGDAVATMGRKDWPHSECGWMAFDLENGGGGVIRRLYDAYVSDEILEQQEWHDSWMFDVIIKHGIKMTNLTPDASGLDVWQHSPMGAWSRHYKGPVAKSELVKQKSPNKKQKVTIQTKNSIPAEEIQSHIEENQKLIKNWVQPCLETDEEIAVVSAGPLMFGEDLRGEVAAGRKIMAVKHSLTRLKEAGITPWAVTLLDPRPHVYNFVDNADTAPIWFVASQVNPSVVLKLLHAGCNVWGYHASVGADEISLTSKQPGSIIHGGSATATRGLYMLNRLGFKNFRLYGYELCLMDKPDLNAKNEYGQPKYLEITLEFRSDTIHQKRCFWTEPQFIAQYEEMDALIKGGKFNFEAFGEGIVPFLVRAKNMTELRDKEMFAKINGGVIPTYQELLKCCQMDKTSMPVSKINSPKPLRKTHLKLSKGSS